MMIDYKFPLIIFGIVWVIYRAIHIILKKKFSFKTELIKALFAFSVVGIYSVTIFPFPFYTYFYSHLPSSINLIPFASIYGSLHHFYYMVPIKNIGGNILLFIPLGFSLPFRFQIRTFWKVTLLGLVTSFVVECCQLFIPMRSFDVDDLMLNTLGTGLGFLLYKLFVQFFSKNLEAMQLKEISKN
jgi:glycopeptide antibiotics resistance protein